MADKKAIKVFNDVGADVSVTDITVVHAQQSGELVLCWSSLFLGVKRNKVVAEIKNLNSKRGYERTFINDDFTALRAMLLSQEISWICDCLSFYISAMRTVLYW